MWAPGKKIIIENFKVVTAEHETKGRVLLSVGLEAAWVTRQEVGSDGPGPWSHVPHRDPKSAACLPALGAVGEPCRHGHHGHHGPADPLGGRVQGCSQALWLVEAAPCPKASWEL